jgi:anthranilate phosphoribosyltransferase
MFQDAQLAHLPTPQTGHDDPFDALIAGHTLAEGQAEQLFTRLVAGDLSDAEMAAMLVALRLKGETAGELVGAARALQAAALPFERPDYLFADSCGTGADGSGSINVSTAVAFVAAACGLPIVKHGNRSVTSRCGSIDVLEALGAKVEVDPSRSRAILDELGICFLYAPQYHPGLKHAGPIRRRLKVRTIMNFLGPCLNPARPPVQLLGVADPAKLEPIARTLAALGCRQALVVHGSGLDEVALHGETQAVRLDQEKIEHLTITPEEAGLKRAPIETVRGGDPAANAAQLEDLLAGRGSGATRDMIAFNTGALFMTAGRTPDLRRGVDLARAAIAEGTPATLLHLYVSASNV